MHQSMAFVSSVWHSTSVPRRRHSSTSFAARLSWISFRPTTAKPPASHPMTFSASSAIFASCVAGFLVGEEFEPGTYHFDLAEIAPLAR